MQSPPFPRYLVPPRSKYSPQHLILKHPQLLLLPQCQRPSFTPIQNNRQNLRHFCACSTTDNIFHLDRLRKTIKTCNVGPRCRFIRNVTNRDKFEPTISVGEWPQTYTLDRAAAGTGKILLLLIILRKVKKFYTYAMQQRLP